MKYKVVLKTTGWSCCLLIELAKNTQALRAVLLCKGQQSEKMSFQWTLIAGYLYFEIFVVIILILPIFSPRRWHLFLKSRLFDMFHNRVGWYFYAFLIVLTLFFFDAIREMRKYSQPNDSSHNLAGEMKASVKLFRAQRNFYITSFTIFLAFVIKRLITMILIQYELEVKAEEIIKKAEETVRQAKSTVLAHNLAAQDSLSDDDMKCKLEVMENLLEEQKFRTKELEVEAKNWKQKYEEVIGAKGDQ